MFVKGWLTDEQVRILAGSLPLIYGDTDYKRIHQTSRDAISVSLVRAACVKLGRLILTKAPEYEIDLSHLLDEARTDPLPEVRFAEEDSV
jgi:hypothetical protein